MVELGLAPLLLAQEVDLVEDQQPRLLARADLRQDAVDCLHVGEPPLLRGGGVDHVQDQVGEDGLLERRLESLNQLVGQLFDETDRVGEQVVAAGELEGPRRRVEGVEEAVADLDLGPGEGVQERRLAGVGVAGEGDPR